MKYKIGTRDSKLALAQTEIICQALLRENPKLTSDQFEIVKIKTIGDKILNKNLIEIGGKNLFIKEIEQALLNKEIDFAVHSLKDMTAKLDSRFVIAACFKREDPRDAFVSSKYKDLASLPIGATLGTSSIRRASVALNYRPDLKIIPFRGNVITRLEKLQQGVADATFLAVAGLKRLGIDQNLYLPISIEEFLPAVSQGVIGVECLKENLGVYNLLRSINHQETEICNFAERAFLECLDADCSVPLAALATLSDEQINLKCQVINSKNEIKEAFISGAKEDAAKLGHEMGLRLKEYL
jgi:hydroxymethylbilane synthase